MNKLQKIALAGIFTSAIMTGAHAQSSIYVGGANASYGDSDVSDSGGMLGYEYMTGESFRYGFGLEAQFYADDPQQSTGNIVSFDGKLGYGLSEDSTMYGIVSYVTQDLGSSTPSDSDSTSMVADGTGFGAGIDYYFTEKVGIKAEYRQYSLEHDLFGESTEYDVDTATVSLAFRL